MLKRNTSGLESHAQQKRETALKRTEDAIAKLIQENRPVNFKTVSEESGVSRTWLYKEPEISQRINEIKNKQNNKVSSKQKIYNDSNNQLIDTAQIKELQEKIKKLERENYALRSHLDVVYGLADPQLAEKVKVLQQENEALKEKLKGINNNIQEQQLKQIQNLESENQKLKDEKQQLQIDLNLAQQKLDEYQQSKNSNKPKLLLLEQKRQELVRNDSTFDELENRLKVIGVKLNKKLNDLIQSLEREQVKNAVSAIEEYLATGKKVTSKAGLLRKALSEGWTPNLTNEKPVISQTKDTFSKWYELAEEEGIVQASQSTSDGLIVLEPTGEWTSFEAMLEKGWTLEYLEQRVKK